MQSTGAVISQTVKSLLADMVSEDRDALAHNKPRRVYTQKQDALADYLGVSRPYMSRKIDSCTWSAADLDRLASFFGKYPMDFVPGEHDDWVPQDVPASSSGAEGDRQSPASAGKIPDNSRLGSRS